MLANMSPVRNQFRQKYTTIVLDAEDKLDASNYRKLINQANTAYQNGSQEIIVDMSRTRTISNCGLVALSTISALLRGNDVSDNGMGWHDSHVKSHTLPYSPKNLKLLNLHPRMKQALKAAGFESFSEIYSDLRPGIAQL